MKCRELKFSDENMRNEHCVSLRVRESVIEQLPLELRCDGQEGTSFVTTAERGLHAETEKCEHEGA